MLGCTLNVMTRTPPPPRRLPALTSTLVMLLAIAVAAVAGGCRGEAHPAAGVAPVERAATVAPPLSDAATATPAGTRTSVEVIREAYEQLHTQLFRDVTPPELLGPAWKGIATEAKRQGHPEIDVTSYARRGSDSIDAFVRAYSDFIWGPGLPLDTPLLGPAAVRAMAAAVGDSHTRFLTPEQAENERRAADGEGVVYQGVGIRIEPDADTRGVIIAEVYDGSPADRAGIKVGDRLLRIDSDDVAGMSVSDVSTRVRGPEGTDVRLTVQSAAGPPRELRVGRARVSPPMEPLVASRMLDDAVGYLRVRALPRRSAAADVAGDVDRQLADLLVRGARAIILDLRGNPGGDPGTSVAVASNFVPDGRIFLSVDRGGKRTDYNALPRATVFRGPLAVLIDRGSASGAEVVASAIEEYGAGRLYGTRTCGCLSVGRPLSLSDTSGIVVTVEQALTGRNERSLEGVGLQPDIAVRGPASAASDPVRDRALAELHAGLR